MTPPSAASPTATLPTERDALLTFLRALLPELHERYGVATMAVFGSRVRDDFTPESDLDLLVTFDRPIGLWAFIGMADELAERFGVKVDLATPSSLKPRLKEAILGSAIPV